MCVKIVKWKLYTTDIARSLEIESIVQKQTDIVYHMTECVNCCEKTKPSSKNKFKPLSKHDYGR